MDAIEMFLQPGLRALAEDGSLLPTSEPPDDVVAETLLVVDLEMSGANPREHEVIDIGGVLAERASAFPERGSWGERVRPLHIGTADHAALKIAGYQAKAWREAVALEDAFGKIAELGRGATIAGWGINNDMAFLAETSRRVGIPWPFATVAVDIQHIARRLLGKGDVDRFNLGHVADRLGIGRMGEHGALADAYATYDVLLKLAERAALSSDGP